MAVLDHDHLHLDIAKRDEGSGLIATCNVCLVFVGLLVIAYVLSLIA
jgi:hypothetical protein